VEERPAGQSGRHAEENRFITLYYIMQRKKYEQVHDDGHGIIKVGSVSLAGHWHLDGLQTWLEITLLNGHADRIKGIMEYGKYTIWFDDVPPDDGLPKAGTTTPLMIDDQKIGGDGTWWVITYLSDRGKLGVELSNRPSG